MINLYSKNIISELASKTVAYHTLYYHRLALMHLPLAAFIAVISIN